MALDKGRRFVMAADDPRCQVLAALALLRNSPWDANHFVKIIQGRTDKDQPTNAASCSVSINRPEGSHDSMNY